MAWEVNTKCSLGYTCQNYIKGGIAAIDGGPVQSSKAVNSDIMQHFLIQILKAKKARSLTDYKCQECLPEAL